MGEEDSSESDSGVKELAPAKRSRATSGRFTRGNKRGDRSNSFMAEMSRARDETNFGFKNKRRQAQAVPGSSVRCSDTLSQTLPDT